MMVEIREVGELFRAEFTYRDILFLDVVCSRLRSDCLLCLYRLGIHSGSYQLRHLSRSESILLIDRLVLLIGR